MAGHNLGTIRGTIEIDYDGAGIVKAVRDSEKASDTLGKLDNASSKTLKGFGSFAKGAVVVSGAVSSLNSAVGLVAGTLATVGPLAGAAFAAAPAVILSYAAAMTIAQIATSGVGDALSAAADGGKKFDEAMEKLSPQAQKFVKAYQKVLPTLDRYKKAIQDSFFNGTDKQVGTIVTRLGTLVPMASRVAAGISAIAQNIILTATNAPNMERLRSVLGGLNAFLAQIKRSIGPVVSGFIGLAAQASAFGGVVGGGLANALAKLSIWLNGLDLNAIFARAMPIIQALASFFGDLVTIAQELFSIFITDGSGAVGVLASLTSQLADFLQSAEGQAALQALGEAMQAIGGAAGQIFLALLQAIAPAIVALAPGVAQLAGQIAGVLVPAINALNPLLTSLAQFLSENMGWLGPLAGVVVGVAAAYKVYAAATDAVVVAKTVLNAAIVRNTALWIGNTSAMVAARITSLAFAASMAIIRVATLAWSVATKALGVAFRFALGPIGIIITVIGLLAAAIMYLWNNNEGFRKAVLAAWKWIQEAAKALWQAIQVAFKAIVSAIGAALNWITSNTRAVWSGIVALVKGYINMYRSIIMTAVNFIRTQWGNFLRGLQTIARAVWSAIASHVQAQINRVKNFITGIKVIVSTVRNVFNNVRSTITSGISSWLSAIRAFPGRAASALGNLGRLLYNKGRDLIRGFVNGIGSMIGAVRAKVSSVVGAVTRFLPGSPAKEGPLSGRGYVLLRARRFMDDFAKGIGDGAPKPAAALIGAVNPLARATVPVGSTAKPATSAIPAPAATAVAGTREYNVNIGDKPFAKLVVDALTGEPVAVKKIADKGAQQMAWAGR